MTAMRWPRYGTVPRNGLASEVKGNHVYCVGRKVIELTGRFRVRNRQILQTSTLLLCARGLPRPEQLTVREGSQRRADSRI